MKNRIMGTEIHAGGEGEVKITVEGDSVRLRMVNRAKNKKGHNKCELLLNYTCVDWMVETLSDFLKRGDK